MATKNKRFRDFVYLDTMRTKSLASQLLGGVRDSIKSERTGTKITESDQGGGEASHALSELRLVEERLLLDNVYNDLEDAMAPALVNPTETEDSSTLVANPLVKVTGTVEFEDYVQLQSYLRNYRDLMMIVARPSFEATKRPKYNSQKEYDKALEAFAAAEGFMTDWRLQDNLRSFAEMLNPNAFYAVCLPAGSDGALVRAVVDRKWLRYSEEILRYLYAGSSMVPCVRRHVK